MANKFKLEVRESLEELEQRRKRANAAVTKEKLLMLYWIASKQVTERQEIAKRLGRDESTVYRWVRTYKKEGIEGLLAIKKAPGKSPYISAEVREKLKAELAKPEGFNSYGEIQKWLEKECQTQVSYKVVHEVVRYKLKAKLKAPRPRSEKAKPEVQERFKKKLSQIIAAMIKYLGKGQGVRLWCQDESRFGLITIGGKVITLRGVKPVRKKQWKRKNFYIYGLIEPRTGEQFLREYERINHQCFQEFLDDFADAEPENLHLILMDNGSFHKALALNWPENIIPIYQPAHSPELNPIERLWQDIKKKLKWRTFDSLADLQKQVSQIIEALSSDLILSLCGWDYIVSALLSATSS